METDRLYLPEDPIPWPRLIPMGLQHVVAMFGATVLAPVLMGFHPQTALFFSGIGTLIFIAVTGFKVPSYLGSSFAFIGPVLAVTGGRPEGVPFALCGIAGASVLYGLAAWAVIRGKGVLIERLMPPVVTGTVVAVIGLNLASTAVANCLNRDFAVQGPEDCVRLLIASATFLAAALTAVYTKGLLRLLPILCGVVAGTALAAALGRLEPGALEALWRARWLGLPPFQHPSWSWHGLLVIAPIFVVLVAENKGHIAAISSCIGRDLSPSLGRAYLGDAAASFLSAMGGGTPQTTYAENMGVMAITRVFSVSNFVAAACIAIALGVCPKFGAVIMLIPNPVLGGVTLVLYGLITMMGVKIWVDSKVDFSSQRNLIAAGAPLIASTGLGVRGVSVFGVNVAGIALGTMLALALNWLMSRGERAPDA
jgi:uracil-xanthine permease